MNRRALLSTASIALSVCGLALRAAAVWAGSAFAFAGAASIWLLASPAEMPAEAFAALADAVRADPWPAALALATVSGVPVFGFWLPDAAERYVRRDRLHSMRRHVPRVDAVEALAAKGATDARRS